LIFDSFLFQAEANSTFFSPQEKAQKFSSALLTAVLCIQSLVHVTNDSKRLHAEIILACRHIHHCCYSLAVNKFGNFFKNFIIPASLLFQDLFSVCLKVLDLSLSLLYLAPFSLFSFFLEAFSKVSLTAF